MTGENLQLPFGSARTRANDAENRVNMYASTWLLTKTKEVGRHAEGLRKARQAPTLTPLEI